MQKQQRCFTARPSEMQGETTAIETPVGTAYVTINFHKGEPLEIIMALGKNGSTERSFVEALARICSTALQHGTPIDALCRQLRGISSELTMGLGPNKILSVPDALGQVMEGYTNGYALDKGIIDG